MIFGTYLQKCKLYLCISCIFYLSRTIRYTNCIKAVNHYNVIFFIIINKMLLYGPLMY